MKVAGTEVVESTKIPEGEIHVYSFPRIVGFRTTDEKIQYMVEHDLLGKIVGIETKDMDNG